MKRRKHYAPRIHKDKRTGRWVGRCAPCGYELSADGWETNLADVLRHVATPSHAGSVALAALSRAAEAGS